MSPAPSSRPPRIACIQWPLKPQSVLEGLLTDIEKQVIAQAALKSDLVIFPELFSLGLLECQHPPRSAMAQLAQLSPAILRHCQDLAIRYRVNILAGSLPEQENNELYNVATFCHRDGRPAQRQYKLHATPYEQREWHLQGGNALQAFDTDIGRCGILICYDVEFPELARQLADQDMELLLVPFWTDSINAYHRVRYCAQARAIENECYVALAGCVGLTPHHPVIDQQHAASAILSPSDYTFPEHAALAEARANEATFIVADLDSTLLHTLRQAGSVRIGRDRRRDLYTLQWHGQPALQFLSLRGRQMLPYLQEIAQLRITVFREFPYLYDGTLEYEMNYLRAYINSPRSLVFLIRDGEQAIGATTALPLVDADREFHPPFRQHHIPLESVYYFGESVLLPEYRGRAFGHRFFDERERYAQELGFNTTAFCAVVRERRHPLRPENYVSLDTFWARRGYQMADGFTCTYPWKDVDQDTTTNKTMQFWIKTTS